MQKRKLKDLNLLDDFLFNSMVTYPGIGESFSRELLRIIFQKDFGIHSRSVCDFIMQK